MENENTPNENLTKNEDSIEKKKFNAQAYFLNSENNTQTDQSPISIVDENRCCGNNYFIFIIVGNNYLYNIIKLL